MLHRFTLILCLTFPVYAFSAADDQFADELRAGEASISKSQFKEAITACRRGLLHLGNEYYSPDVVDDSGMKLALAEIQEREGDLRPAATITCRILEGRISQLEYKRKAKNTNPTAP